MPDLILYLLKINIALILFYLAYRFALRRLTFYTLNRFFLVAGIVFSSVYPFFDLSDLLRKNPELNDQLIVIAPDFNAVQQIALHQLPAQAAAFNYWQLIIALFWTGVILMALRLLIQLISLYRIHQSSTPENNHNFKFRRIDGKVNPFSFWQSIYLNPDQHEQEELKSILKHEQVHIDEWHTLDILLAELSMVFYWFNPGVWLMKQAVRENLEFITDRKVLQSGMDSKMYQYSLVQISSLPKSYSLANNFNFMSIKKRIMMMNRKQSSKVQISKYLLIPPLVVLLTLIFTISEAQLEKKPLNGLTQNGLSVINKVLSATKSGITGVISTVVQELPESTLFKDAPTEKTLLTDTAIVLSKFDSLFEPGLKIDAQMDHIKTMARTVNFAIKPDTPNIIIKNSGMPLFVIDGIPSTAEQFNKLAVTDIKDVTVIKDGAATIYGERGANGVILITTKRKFIADTIKTSTGIITIRSYGKPLYVIDGISANENAFNRLRMDEIDDISLVKDGSATIYGSLATDGLILISTRSTITVEFVKLIKSSSKLIVINGKEATRQQIEDISSPDIRGIRILVEDSSIKEYGEKGKNGVIVITTVR